MNKEVKKNYRLFQRKYSNLKIGSKFMIVGKELCKLQSSENNKAIQKRKQPGRKRAQNSNSLATLTDAMMFFPQFIFALKALGFFPLYSTAGLFSIPSLYKIRSKHPRE